jgi:hypothetical protein
MPNRRQFLHGARATVLAAGLDAGHRAGTSGAEKALIA